MNPSAPVRLLLRGAASGARNMAVDEAILEACREGHGPVTLSIYGWAAPCLSLGYFQKSQIVDQDACARMGLEIVRRPTGGWAVLHDRDVTYSLVAPVGHPLVGGGVVASYRKASEGILKGLASLGVGAELASPVRRETPSPACFDSTWGHEVAVAGRKVVGSAQVRRGAALLQQGSILLALDQMKLFLALEGNHTEEAARGLSHRATSLGQLLGREVTFEEVSEAVVRGFAAAWDVAWTRDELSPDEEAAAQRLTSEKYGQPEWTFRR